MKKRTTNDQRVMQANGMKSLSRELIIEALETVAKEGATVDEIVDLIGKDLPSENKRMSVGGTLSRMEADNYVICYRNRWYLKEYLIENAPTEPATVTILPHANGKIAPMVQKRSGKNVSLFTSPREMEDVVRVSLVIKGQTFPIPLWGNMWICYGQTVPDWDAEKETYYNVETIRLLLKNGHQHEEHPSPSDTVTIAQG